MRSDIAVALVLVVGVLYLAWHLARFATAAVEGLPL